MDAHTEYASDYVVRCLEVMQETGAESVGGPWVARGTTYCQRAIAAVFASRSAVGGALSHQAEHEGPVDTVYLGCWRRDVLEAVGLFDEDLVRNQDNELHFRILRSGGRVWQSPRIRSWYTPRDSLWALCRQYYQYGYWRVRVLQKHGRPAALRHVIPGAFSATLLSLGMTAPFSDVAQVGLAGVCGLYLGAVLCASVATAARAGWSLLPVLPAVFPCYQVSYGLGYLVGVWDFLVRRRGGRYVALTRR